MEIVYIQKAEYVLVGKETKWYENRERNIKNQNHPGRAQAGSRYEDMELNEKRLKEENTTRLVQLNLSQLNWTINESPSDIVVTTFFS